MKKIFIIMIGLMTIMSCKPDTLDEVITLNDAIDVALTEVMPDYPTATLLEVHSFIARDADGNVIPNKVVTKNTEVIFRLRGTDEGRTLYVTFEDLTPFVTIDDKAFLGDNPIPTYIDLQLAGAIEILNKKGIEVPTDNVSLRHPTNLNSYEAQYVFGSQDSGSINVGVYTRNVYN